MASQARTEGGRREVKKGKEGEKEGQYGCMEGGRVVAAVHTSLSHEN
jgi:hypothetical protein